MPLPNPPAVTVMTLPAAQPVTPAPSVIAVMSARDGVATMVVT